MARTFTVDQARALVPALRTTVDRIVALRADLADAQIAQQRGEPAPVGGLAEVKAVEARMQEAIDWFAATGIQLKGIAPVIVDFPGELNGEPVLLCWLEGEADLGWYHPDDVGFMGRRPLRD